MLARQRGGRWPFRALFLVADVGRGVGIIEVRRSGIGGKASLKKLLKDRPPICKTFNGFAAGEKISFIRLFFQRKPTQGHG
jgi:hypothetical protein